MPRMSPGQPQIGTMRDDIKESAPEESGRNLKDQRSHRNKSH